MKLYDEVINKWSSLLEGCSLKNLNINGDCAKDAGSHQMILKSDCAYELGGSTPSVHALGATAVTGQASFFCGDEIILAGPDLKDIDKDISFARLTIVQVAENALGDGNTLYNAIKKIDNVRFHVNPEGYMPRISSVYGRESIRISKEALNKGLSFEKVGNLLIKKLKENPDVKAVKLIYITDPGFNFNELEASVKESADITKAIDHIMKNAMTDCNTCALQKVCDEVEGLRELHFGTEGQSLAR